MMCSINTTVGNVDSNRSSNSNRPLFFVRMGLYTSDESSKEKMKFRFRTYGWSEIRKVYERHHRHRGSVLYSEDDGLTWQTVCDDTGKWHMDWLFAFMEL